MNTNPKEELYLEVLGFLRSACAELISVVDAGAKFYPAELRREALQFIAISRSTLAKVNGVLELASQQRAAPPKPEPEPEPEEWYDSLGRPCPNGAYDAGGHYYAERDAGGDCDEI